MIENEGFIPVCLLNKQWFCIYYSKSRNRFFLGPHFPEVSLYNDAYIIAQQLAQQEFVIPVEEQEDNDEHKIESSYHTSSSESEDKDEGSPTNNIDQEIRGTLIPLKMHTPNVKASMGLDSTTCTKR